MDAAPQAVQKSRRSDSLTIDFETCTKVAMPSHDHVSASVATAASPPISTAHTSSSRSGGDVMQCDNPSDLPEWHPADTAGLRDGWNEAEITRQEMLSDFWSRCYANMAETGSQAGFDVPLWEQSVPPGGRW